MYHAHVVLVMFPDFSIYGMGMRLRSRTNTLVLHSTLTGQTLVVLLLTSVWCVCPPHSPLLSEGLQLILQQRKKTPHLANISLIYHMRNFKMYAKQLAYSVSSGGSHSDKLKFDGRRSADKPSFVNLSHEGLSCFILGESRDGGSLVNHTLLIGWWWL